MTTRTTKASATVVWLTWATVRKNSTISAAAEVMTPYRSSIHRGCAVCLAINRGLSQAEPMTARILVIDDEPQITRVLRAALSAQRYDVRIANDPQEALRTVEEWKPDLIITDLAMPDISGVELCRTIRQKLVTP